MSAQHIQVYGDPILCHSDDCENDAAVMYRVITEDDVESVVLCFRCWQQWSKAFRQAEMDTEVTVRFGDEGDSRGTALV